MDTNQLYRFTTVLLLVSLIGCVGGGDSIEDIVNNQDKYAGQVVTVSGILVFYGGESNPAGMMSGDGYELRLSTSCFQSARIYEFEKRYTATGTVTQPGKRYDIGVWGMTSREPGIICSQPIK